MLLDSSQLNIFFTKNEEAQRLLGEDISTMLALSSHQPKLHPQISLIKKRKQTRSMRGQKNQTHKNRTYLIL